MNLYEGSLPQETDEEPTEITREQFEDMRRDYRDIIMVDDALRRLHDNPDFQLLIINGYMTDEVQRLAALMGSGKVNPKTFEDCAEQIKSVGYLKEHLRQKAEQGTIAKAELAGLEEAYNAAVEAGIMEG